MSLLVNGFCVYNIAVSQIKSAFAWRNIDIDWLRLMTDKMEINIFEMQRIVDLMHNQFECSYEYMPHWTRS